MSYVRQIRVEFNHCDPAGIVFYPRYFEMTNSVCENFFREEVGHSYHAMMADRTGVPTVRLEADFRAPSRLGDLLDWDLVIEKVGNASAAFRLTAHCEAELRLVVRKTLVWLGPDMRAGRWPDAVRAGLTAHLETS
jgi:4-hydroxybenzoyl-CoA thioesterase